ncbi:hypothetical protein IP91_03945 [Pseudoduganella lurida]|uniref:Uncharacterized protein n=2 Tax=Pseudoduganella lurida TaxID=1036180 RepID=A0A562R3H3_9BURK|nr:hypothetical protein IP91_03945 [Pseudoduganella lurida]
MEPFSVVQALWRRRDLLRQDEWQELYRRVLALLQGDRPDEAARLPDTLDALQHAWFMERVYLVRCDAAPDDAAVLRQRFRRFLQDQLHRPLPEAEVFNEDWPCSLPAEDDAALRPYGVTGGEVRDAAAAFLRTLPADLLVLLQGYCTPRRRLAPHVAAAHYHGGALGLAHFGSEKHGAAPEVVLPAHADTLLARWLAGTLRRENGLGPGDSAAVRIVLDCLCAMASAPAVDGPDSGSPEHDALTPPLPVVAARLAADGDGAGDGTGSAADWRDTAVPPDALLLFARAEAAAALAQRVPAPGQIHLLTGTRSALGLLLDSWQPERGCWRGRLVTPDASYAGPTDLVIDARDAPVDGRAGLVLGELLYDAAPALLGPCLGVLGPARLQALALHEERGNDGQALPRPGVVARRAVGSDYVLTGTPLFVGDPRATYLRLVSEAASHAGLREVPWEVTARGEAIMAWRWRKVVVIVAVALIGVLAVWLFH